MFIICPPCERNECNNKHYSYLESDSSTLINPNVAYSIEVKAPNTPSSNVTYLTSSTLAEVGVRL